MKIPPSTSTRRHSRNRGASSPNIDEHIRSDDRLCARIGLRLHGREKIIFDQLRVNATCFGLAQHRRREIDPDDRADKTLHGQPGTASQVDRRANAVGAHHAQGAGDMLRAPATN
jgi:hypothetical protein